MSFSKNETVELMHLNTSDALRKIATHIEKWEMDWQEVVNILREISDEQEAQAIVVNLRENINH